MIDSVLDLSKLALKLKDYNYLIYGEYKNRELFDIDVNKVDCCTQIHFGLLGNYLFSLLIEKDDTLFFDGEKIFKINKKDAEPVLNFVMNPLILLKDENFILDSLGKDGFYYLGYKNKNLDMISRGYLENLSKIIDTDYVSIEDRFSINDAVGGFLYQNSLMKNITESYLNTVDKDSVLILNEKEVELLNFYGDLIIGISFTKDINIIEGRFQFFEKAEYPKELLTLFEEILSNFNLNRKLQGFYNSPQSFDFLSQSLI